MPTKASDVGRAKQTNKHNALTPGQIPPILDALLFSLSPFFMSLPLGCPKSQDALDHD